MQRRATAEGAAQQPPRHAAWWHWPLLTLLVGLTLGCMTAFQVVVITGEVTTNPVDFALALQPVMWTVPGLVVLRRADWHPVGWMLVAIGLGYAMSFDLAYTAVWDQVFRIGSAWAAWFVDGWGNFVGFAFTVALVTVFPGGMAGLGTRERRWGWVRIISSFAAILAAALTTTVGGYEGNTFPDTYPNPTGLGFISPRMGAWAILIVLINMAASPYSLWRRSRRVGEAQRRQYTWVLFPFALLVSLIVVAIALSSVIGDRVWYPVVFMYFILPVAFSIAMVRYRWFDIDRIVSRTVSYAAVALVIAGVYVVPVVVLPEVLGLSSDLAVALATLAAAAVFAPVRRRVQTFVDRRFDRERYDAERVVAAFSGRLQTAVDLERVTDELGGAVGIALRPSRVSVWFAERASR